MSRINQILCPVDFSEASNKSVDYAISLLKQLGFEHPEDHLLLLHVYSFPMYALPEGGMVAGPEMVAEIMNHAKSTMLQFVKHSKGRNHVSGNLLHQIENGDPGDVIIEISKKKKVDLIVMGTHGRKGLTHFWLGSVAEKVVRSSDTPVLTVRTEG